MIEVRFLKKNDKLKGFEIKGHAEYDDIGLDIVCAAVTSNAIAVINSLEELVKVEFESVTADAGIIECSVSDRYINDSQLLLKHLKLALNSISEDYPENIKILKAGGDSKC